MTTPFDPDRREALVRSPFPGDDTPVVMTAYQAQRCATLIQGYRRGHEAFGGALDAVADLLMIAGITAAANDPIDGPAAREEAWLDVDSWPWPRHGAPRPQPE